MNRVKELREQRKMKQAELGLLLHVKEATISKYETGKIQLTDDTLIKLADIFDVSVDYILCRDNSNNNINNETLSSVSYEKHKTDVKEQHILDLYRQDPEGITELLESFSALSRRNKTIILGKCYELEKEDTTVNSDMTDKEKEVRKAT